MCWDKEIDKPGYHMPFMPKDGYVSRQNPPDFTWTGIEGSESYDIVVCSDKELSDVKYAKYGLIYNFHNFNTVFETGVEYYWAVRCHKDGIPTEWSTPRRFRIHPKALEFPVPEVDAMLENIGDSHPRICTSAERLADFRKKREENAEAKTIADSYISRARNYVKEGVIGDEPTFVPHPDWVIHSRLKMELLARSGEIVTKAYTCGFAYLLTGDKSFAEFGIKVLLSIAKWDINGATSYKNQDQVHRDIAYRCAMAYDWLANAMTDEERRVVLDMIRERTKIMEYLLPRLKNCPYDSHGWTAFGYIGIIAIATYGEIPEAKDWLRQIIPQYTVILPPWSYQDGGWCQGTDYWQYSTGSNKEFIDVLATAGIINLYKKAWQHNEYLWSLYAYPRGLTGSFGDQSNRSASGDASKTSLYRDAFYSKNPVAKWLAEGYGKLSNQYFNYAIADVEKMESVCPAAYQLSHHFSDIGWVVMGDNVLTPERVVMTFKSSPYGSFNHSHADQNSFIIQAFGENLAIKSGYYDAYHSKHDSGFTRTSHAHNTVTLSKSRGQKDDSLAANGYISAFTTQLELDLAVGDATAAYVGALDKFRRHIVYIRPEVYIVIDDLKANEGEKESFEWWLNAENDISLSDDRKSAYIKEGVAALDCSVVYPKAVNGELITTFSGSDGAVYPAEGSYTKANVQKRVYFETEKLAETKMVSVIDVHRASEKSKNITAEYFDTYVKINVEDKAVVYVNLLPAGECVTTADGIVFDGACAVFTEKSAMLSEGRTLIKNGETVIAFESPASCTVGCDELSVSTPDDNTLTLGIGSVYCPDITSVTDYDGLAASSAIGVNSFVKSDKSAKLSLQRDEYSFMLNGKLIGGNELEGELDLVVDGECTTYKTKGVMARNCKPYFTYKSEIPLANYIIVQAGDEVVISEFPDRSLGAITSTLSISSMSTRARVEIASKNTKIFDAENDSDFDGVKEKLDIFFEAESFFGSCAAGAHVYSTRPFLSGGAGVTGFNNATTTLTYKVNVEVAGEYDFVVKYVSWERGGALRSLFVDCEERGFNLKETGSWGTTPEEWRAATVPIGVHLDKGEHTLVIQPRSGFWNIDWFGLKKR